MSESRLEELRARVRSRLEASTPEYSVGGERDPDAIAYDADTVYSGGRGYRMDGMDASELETRSGKVERDMLNEIAAREGINVQPTGEKDHYGRDIAEYQAGGEDITSRMIAEGAGNPRFADLRGDAVSLGMRAHDARELLDYSPDATTAGYREQLEETNPQFQFRNPGYDAKHPETGFLPSVARGVDQAHQSYYGGLQVFAQLTDDEDLKKTARRGIVRNRLEAFENPAEYTSFDDVDSAGDMFGLAIEATGEFVGQFGPEIAASVATGGTFAAGSAASRLAIGAGLQTAFKSGATAGFIGSNFAQMTGEQQQELNARGVEDPGAAVTGGLLGTALELGGTYAVLKPFAKAIKKVQKLPSKSLADKRKFARVVSETAIKAGLGGSISEGTTEMAQNALQNVITQTADPTFDAFSEDEISEMLFAALKGASAGGTIGTAGGTMQGVSDYARSGRDTSPRQEAGTADIGENERYTAGDKVQQQVEDHIRREFEAKKAEIEARKSRGESDQEVPDPSAEVDPEPGQGQSVSMPSVNTGGATAAAAGQTGQPKPAMNKYDRLAETLQQSLSSFGEPTLDEMQSELASVERKLQENSEILASAVNVDAAQTASFLRSENEALSKRADSLKTRIGELNPQGQSLEGTGKPDETPKRPPRDKAFDEEGSKRKVNEARQWMDDQKKELDARRADAGQSNPAGKPLPKGNNTRQEPAPRTQEQPKKAPPSREETEASLKKMSQAAKNAMRAARGKKAARDLEENDTLKPIKANLNDVQKAVTAKASAKQKQQRVGRAMNGVAYTILDSDRFGNAKDRATAAKTALGVVDRFSDVDDIDSMAAEPIGRLKKFLSDNKVAQDAAAEYESFLAEEAAQENPDLVAELSQATQAQDDWTQDEENQGFEDSDQDFSYQEAQDARAEESTQMESSRLVLKGASGKPLQHSKRESETDVPLPYGLGYVDAEKGTYQYSTRPSSGFSVHQSLKDGELIPDVTSFTDAQMREIKRTFFKGVSAKDLGAALDEAMNTLRNYSSGDGKTPAFIMDVIDKVGPPTRLEAVGRPKKLPTQIQDGYIEFHKVGDKDSQRYALIVSPKAQGANVYRSPFDEGGTDSPIYVDEAEFNRQLVAFGKAQSKEAKVFDPKTKKADGFSSLAKVFPVVEPDGSKPQDKPATVNIGEMAKSLWKNRQHLTVAEVNNRLEDSAVEILAELEFRLNSQGYTFDALQSKGARQSLFSAVVDSFEAAINEKARSFKGVTDKELKKAKDRASITSKIKLSDLRKRITESGVDKPRTKKPTDLKVQIDNYRKAGEQWADAREALMEPKVLAAAKKLFGVPDAESLADVVSEKVPAGASFDDLKKATGARYVETEAGKAILNAARAQARFRSARIKLTTKDIAEADLGWLRALVLNYNSEKGHKDIEAYYVPENPEKFLEETGLGTGDRDLDAQLVGRLDEAMDDEIGGRELNYGGLGADPRDIPEIAGEDGVDNAGAQREDEPVNRRYDNLGGIIIPRSMDIPARGVMQKRGIKGAVDNGRVIASKNVSSKLIGFATNVAKAMGFGDRVVIAYTNEADQVQAIVDDSVQVARRKMINKYNRIARSIGIESLDGDAPDLSKGRISTLLKKYQSTKGGQHDAIAAELESELKGTGTYAQLKAAAEVAKRKLTASNPSSFVFQTAANEDIVFLGNEAAGLKGSDRLHAELSMLSHELGHVFMRDAFTIYPTAKGKGKDAKPGEDLAKINATERKQLIASYEKQVKDLGMNKKQYPFEEWFADQFMRQALISSLPQARTVARDKKKVGDMTPAVEKAFHKLKALVEQFVEAVDRALKKLGHQVVKDRFAANLIHSYFENPSKARQRRTDAPAGRAGTYWPVTKGNRHIASFSGLNEAKAAVVPLLAPVARATGRGAKKAGIKAQRAARYAANTPARGYSQTKDDLIKGGIDFLGSIRRSKPMSLFGTSTGSLLRIADNKHIQELKVRLDEYGERSAQQSMYWVSEYNRVYETMNQDQKTKFAELVIKEKPAKALTIDDPKVEKALREWQATHAKFGKDVIGKISSETALREEGTHFPHVPDLQAIVEKKDLFIHEVDKQLVEYNKAHPNEKITAEEVYQFYAKAGDMENVSENVPSAGSAKERKFQFIDISKGNMRKFYDTDPMSVMQSYVDMAVKRQQAEASLGGTEQTVKVDENGEPVLGEDGEPEMTGSYRADLKVKKALDSVDHPEDKKAIRKIVAAQFGQVESVLPTWAQKAMDYSVLGTNWFMLQLMVFSMPQELGFIAPRLRDPQYRNEALKALGTKGWSGMKANVARAEMYNTIQQITVNEVLSDRFGIGTVSRDAKHSRNIRQWNDFLFKMNGAAWATRHIRAVATTVAEGFFRQAHTVLSNPASSKDDIVKAKKYLKEVNLEPEDARFWFEDLGEEIPSEARMVELGFDKKQIEKTRKIKAAVQMFVQDVHPQPLAKDLPTWMSNPDMRWLALYKQYFYAMSKHIFPQIKRYILDNRAQGAYGMLLMAGVMMSIAGLALEARELVKWGVDERPVGSTRHMDMEEYLVELFFRSGFAFGADPYINAWNSTGQGDSPIVSASPVMSFYDALLQDANNAALRSTPFVGMNRDLVDVLDFDF